MKQDQDLKQGPVNKDPSPDVFAKLMAAVTTGRLATIRYGSGGSGSSRKKIDPVKRKARKQMAKLSKRGNRR